MIEKLQTKSLYRGRMVQVRMVKNQIMLKIHGDYTNKYLLTYRLEQRNCPAQLDAL